MASFWYCKGNDRELGPFSLRQLQALTEAGKVFPDTPLREKGSEQWITAAHLDELFPAMGEPVAAEAAAPRTEAAVPNRSGPMKAVRRAKPLVEAEAPKPPPAPVAAAQAAVRAVPRGQPIPVAAGPASPIPVAPGPASPIPAVMPAPVMREVKPIVSITPAGGTTSGSAGVPRGGGSGMDDMCSIAAVGLGLVGLATFMIPYAPVALGLLAAGAGTVVFFLSQKSERALGLSIGGLVLGLAAAAVGAYQMNNIPTEEAKQEKLAQEEAKKAALAQKETPAASLDPAAAEEARNAKILADAAAAKEREERNKPAPPPETPVGTERPAAKPQVATKGPASGLPQGDPRRPLVEGLKKWYRTPGGITFKGDKSIKVSAAWLSDNPSAPKPEPPKPTRRIEAGPPMPMQEFEPEERIAIPGVDSSKGPPREGINRPKELDAPLTKPVEDAPAAGGGPVMGGPAASGKYLCIEVQILVSPEGKALSFGGWSAAAKNLVLLDGEGKPLTPAPPGKLKATTIDPGETHSQVLAFECPNPAPEVVRLALAGGVVSLKAPLGFEINRDLFVPKTASPTVATPMAEAPERPQRPAPTPSADPPAAEGDVPPAKPDMPEKKPVDEDEEARQAFKREKEAIEKGKAEEKK